MTPGEAGVLFAAIDGGAPFSAGFERPLEGINFESTLGVAELLGPRQSFECELQFYVPAAHLPGRARSAELKTTEITQAYFEKANLGRITAFVLERIGSLGEYDREEFTSARLRKQSATDGDEYTLDIKGKKTGPEGMKVMRPEISVRLSENEYLELLPEATRGSLSKSRTHLVGEVIDSDGVAHEVKLHVDILRSAGGQDLKRSAMLLPDFALVEVEFFGDRESCLRRAERFRQGHHDQEFLRYAPEVSALGDKVVKCLRSRRLALNGIGKEARSLLFDLHAEALVRRRGLVPGCIRNE